MLELYNFSQSTCSLKVRICLAEKKLAWVDHRLVSKNHDHLSDWYLRLNPNGVVPTLVHDGTPIIESSVIVQYLDDAFPEISLSPIDPVSLAKMRAWLVFVDQVPTPAVRYPSFQFGGLRLKFQAMSDEEFAEKAQKRPLKAGFYEKMGRNGFAEDEITQALDDIRKTAQRMDRMFDVDGGPWLLGAQYTLGDICVAPLLDRMEDLGFADLWGDYPSVTDWLARIQKRPAYDEAYYAGSRLSEQYPELGLGRDNPRSARQQA